MIHHIAGFIQIAKTQCAVLHTLCIRMKKYSCSSYGSKQIYIHNLSRIYFFIKDTRWWIAWDHASILLSPYSFHFYSRRWRDRMVANHLRKQCLTTCILDVGNMNWCMMFTPRYVWITLLHRYPLPKVEKEHASSGRCYSGNQMSLQAFNTS